MPYPVLPPTIPLVAQLPPAESSTDVASVKTSVSTLSEFKQQNLGRTVADFQTSVSEPDAEPDPTVTSGNEPESLSLRPNAATLQFLTATIPTFVPAAPDNPDQVDRVARFLSTSPATSTPIALEEPPPEDPQAAVPATSLKQPRMTRHALSQPESRRTPVDANRHESFNLSDLPPESSVPPAPPSLQRSSLSQVLLPSEGEVSPSPLSPKLGISGSDQPNTPSAPLEKPKNKRRKKGKSAPAVPDVPPQAPVIELKADRQEYDQDRQILTAEGNVVMRYQGAILDTDRLQISFLKRQAVAEGNASLLRGSQKLLGDRLEFNYGSNSGRVFNARSEIYLKTLGSDTTLPTNAARTGVSEPLVSQRLLLQQPMRDVVKVGEFSFVNAFGGFAGVNRGQVNVPQSGGSVNRLRLEADQIQFDSRGWEAANVRLTNDPFSPPELELRAKKARVTAIGPYEDELYMGNGRLVFDQKNALPLFSQRYVINRRKNGLVPTPVGFGYDAQERGGFFIQRTQTLLNTSKVQWSITPQFYLQAALSPKAFRQKLGIGNKTGAKGILDPDLYGFRTDITAELTPKTQFQGFLSLTSLNDLTNNLRSRLTLRQALTDPRPNQACINRFLPKPKTPPSPQPQDPPLPNQSDRPQPSLSSNLATPSPLTTELPRQLELELATPDASPENLSPLAVAQPDCAIFEVGGNYTIAGEYTYRDRLFNGSLGFQTVQQSLGAVLTSPIYQLGRTRINLSYQASAQQVNADTDRADLLPANPKNSRIDLGRFQTSVALSHYVNLWEGAPLPPTPTQGLKYTPVPVLPYFGVVSGLTGVGSFYTSGDTQNYVQALIGIQGQFGHFSRPYLDYTGFNLSLVQVFLNGKSPFLFDRVADQRFLSAGFSQQLYGPLRIGVQSALNLETGKQISTDYTLEYSRRTYSITLRFNPVQKIGSVNLIITDFNWGGGIHPFSNQEIRAVEGGIIQSNY